MRPTEYGKNTYGTFTLSEGFSVGGSNGAALLSLTQLKEVDMERDEHMDRHVLSSYALEQGLLMNFVFKREALFRPERYQEWLGKSEYKDRFLIYGRCAHITENKEIFRKSRTCYKIQCYC